MVFILAEDATSVLKATIDSTGNVSFEEETFTEVLDIAVHPTQHCLAVLTKNSLHLTFRHIDDSYIALPSTFAAVRSGKLKVGEK